MKGPSYLVILVNLPHTAFTLVCSDNLSRVLHNNLVRLEATVASHAITTIRSLDDLNTNSVLAALVSTSCKIRKGTVLAMSSASIAIGVITLIKHNAVLAALRATVFGSADTL